MHLWDLSPQIAALDAPKGAAGKAAAAAGGGSGGGGKSVAGKPAFSFGGHAEEGYAIGWSPVVPYRMATGDNAAKIHVWERREDGSFHVNPTPCAGHTGSVEDIQWSPSEKNVFASGSSDGTNHATPPAFSYLSLTVRTTLSHRLFLWLTREDPGPRYRHQCCTSLVLHACVHADTRRCGCDYDAMTLSYA